jgi:hypothetical protein
VASSLHRIRRERGARLANGLHVTQQCLLLGRRELLDVAAQIVAVLRVVADEAEGFQSCLPVPLRPARLLRQGRHLPPETSYDPF